MSQRLSPQTLRRLTYFAAIADAGSIREASRRLGISVASVSEALAALEDELGVTLAARNTRRLQLTEEGRRVERVAHRILDAGKDLFVDQTDPSELTGFVALTAPVEIAQAWLPARLEEFRRRSPKVEFLVSASDLVVDLSKSHFDLAVRAWFDPPVSYGVSRAALPLSCVSAAPLVLSPHEGGWFTPLILLSQSRADYLHVFDRRSGETKKIQFQGCLQVDNRHVALEMVARGMGAALVSKLAAKSIQGLVECPPHLEFGFIRLTIEMRDKRPSAAALAVKNSLSWGLD